MSTARSRLGVELDGRHRIIRRIGLDLGATNDGIHDELVAKLEARLSSTGGGEARARLLQELRIRVEAMERTDASGTRRREVAAALDFLQQMLDEDAPLVEGPHSKPSTPLEHSRVERALESLAARAPRSAQ